MCIIAEYFGLQLLNERSSRELEQMQQKNSKLQQDCEQASADKERLSLDNLQNTNELKVNTQTHLCTNGIKPSVNFDSNGNIIASAYDNTADHIRR